MTKAESWRVSFAFLPKFYNIPNIILNLLLHLSRDWIKASLN